MKNGIVCKLQNNDLICCYNINVIFIIKNIYLNRISLILIIECTNAIYKNGVDGTAKSITKKRKYSLCYIKCNLKTKR